MCNRVSLRPPPKQSDTPHGFRGTLVPPQIENLFAVWRPHGNGLITQKGAEPIHPLRKLHGSAAARRHQNPNKLTIQVPGPIGRETRLGFSSRPDADLKRLAPGGLSDPSVPYEIGRAH